MFEIHVQVKQDGKVLGTEALLPDLSKGGIPKFTVKPSKLLNFGTVYMADAYRQAVDGKKSLAKGQPKKSDRNGPVTTRQETTAEKLTRLEKELRETILAAKSAK